MIIYQSSIFFKIQLLIISDYEKLASKTIIRYVKNYPAFHAAYRMLRSGLKQKILYLADSNILVVYYSAQEHTKGVAEIVADALGADVFVIEPVNIYTEDDLNWTNEQSRVVTEHNDENRHTELVSTTVENWDSYDTVLIGYPLWWREASWVVNDFVMDNDFSGKDVIPFCTSMSDGIGDSGVHLAEMAGTGNWLEGMRFSENYDTAEVTEWVDSLNLQ